VVTLDVKPVREKSDLVQDKDTGKATISRFATYYKNHTRTNDYLNTVLTDCLKAIKTLIDSEKTNFVLVDFTQKIHEVIDSQNINTDNCCERDFYQCFEKYIEHKFAINLILLYI